MSFVQNFPFFSIILSLVCAVVSFAANARWARRLSIFLLSASVVLQGSLLVYCTVHHVRYSYMMGHYPAPWGNELTAGILEPFLAMLFAGVMLLCVLGGMGRILRDVPADKQKLYWVMVDLAHVAADGPVLHQRHFHRLCVHRGADHRLLRPAVGAPGRTCPDCLRPLYDFRPDGLRPVPDRRHLHLFRHRPPAVPPAAHRHRGPCGPPAGTGFP